MPSRRLNVFSHCAKSPWFARTWSENNVYTEYAGRLVLQSLGGDAVEEYWTLRKKVGLFDVPERPLEIRGSDAVAFLNHAFTRPVDKLRLGRGSYGLLCHQGGGMVCDGILFRLSEDRYWYVHADADVRLWLTALAVDYRVEILDPGSWVLQVQGPKSLQVLGRAIDGELPGDFRYFDAFQGSMGGQPVLVSRTGWSAELGFEVYNMDADVDGPALWDHLLAAGKDYGIRPCGQMSMNIRRIEGGILNYPTDITWDTTPYDVGLGAFVDLDGHDFVGHDALCRADKSPRFTGFRCDSRRISYGSTVMSRGRAIGRVTAYEISPYLECGIGFALLDSPQDLQSRDLRIDDADGEACRIEFVELPFYDAAKNIPRGLPSPDDLSE